MLQMQNSLLPGRKQTVLTPAWLALQNYLSAIPRAIFPLEICIHAPQRVANIVLTTGSFADSSAKFHSSCESFTPLHRPCTQHPNMGGRLTAHMEEKQYQVFEGGLLSACVLVATIVLALTMFLFLVKHFCPKKVKNLIIPPKCNCAMVIVVVLTAVTLILAPLMCLAGSATCLLGLICGRGRELPKIENLKRDLHTILVAMFPDLITNQIHACKTGDESTTSSQIAIKMEEEKEKIEKEVYLFSNKKFQRGSCCSSYLHGYTYFYYLSMIIMAALWFIVMVTEHAIYRKTTTCNDINVADNSFTCFDVTDEFHPTLIKCEESNPQNTSVFCYLYNPNLAAFGIGYSVFKLVLFIVTIYSKAAIKLSESKCGRKFMITAQIILTVLSLTALPAILPAVHFTATTRIYFFHGNAVARWAMFVLIITTTVLGIQVPWCGFTHKTTYKSMVLKKRVGSRKSTAKNSSQGTAPVNREVEQGEEEEGNGEGEISQPIQKGSSQSDNQPHTEIEHV
jgi:hypothetical protein